MIVTFLHDKDLGVDDGDNTIFDILPESDAQSEDGRKRCPLYKRAVSVTARGLARFHKFEGNRCAGTSENLSDLPFAFDSAQKRTQSSKMEVQAECSVCGHINPTKALYFLPPLRPDFPPNMC